MCFEDGNTPSPGNDTSLISIDPAIFRQITNAQPSDNELRSKSTKSPPIFSVEQQEYQLRKIVPDDNFQEKAQSKTLGKARKNSLRRVKNSTEVLRQRSTKGQHEVQPSEDSSSGRTGRHFTVGNVGTGGKLYLRCASSTTVSNVNAHVLSSTGLQQTNQNSKHLKHLRSHRHHFLTVHSRMRTNSTASLWARDKAYGRIPRFRTRQEERN